MSTQDSNRQTQPAELVTDTMTLREGIAALSRAYEEAGLGPETARECAVADIVCGFQTSTARFP